MDNLKLTVGIISLLQNLFPGFLAAWVFYGFTSYLKPSQFERIVQALIFTFIIRLIMLAEQFMALKIGNFYSLGVWSENSELICSAITAVFLGLVTAYVANNDRIHKWFRDIEIFGAPITQQSSFSSEWFATFSNPEYKTWIVLHLEDGRRIYGWPSVWPSVPDIGHFLLEQPSWLVWDGEEPIENVRSIMIKVKDVKWVEFIDKSIWEVKSNG